MSEAIGRHSEAVWDCAFSADGSFFATASRDRTVKLWDTDSVTEVTTLRGHEGEVGACAVSPNGRFVVSAGDDGQVRAWMLGGVSLPEDLRVPAGRSDLVLGDGLTMRAHRAPVLGCAVSADARHTVSASEDQTLKLWDVRGGEALATLKGHRGPVLDCAFSPDASMIVSASVDESVRIWDVADCRALAALHGHSGLVTSCAFSPDGAFVVSGSVDSRVLRFDPYDGTSNPLGEHDGPVLACAVSPDASFVASAGADATLRLWHANDRRELGAVALTSGLQCVALHPHRPTGLCGDHAGGVYLIDLVGVEYGPLTISAIDADDRPGDPVILCPRCRTLMADSKELLGTSFACPGCSVQVRINPLVASSPTPVPTPRKLPPGMSAEDAAIMEQFLPDPPPRLGRQTEPPPKKRRVWGKRR